MTKLVLPKLLGNVLLAKYHTSVTANLIKKSTWITKTHKSSTGLVLTNKPLSFESSSVIETGLSDHQKLIATFFKSHFTKVDRNTICLLQNFKNFDLSTNDPKKSYSFITDASLQPRVMHI